MIRSFSLTFMFSKPFLIIIWVYCGYLESCNLFPINMILDCQLRILLMSCVFMIDIYKFMTAFSKYPYLGIFFYKAWSFMLVFNSSISAAIVHWRVYFYSCRQYFLWTLFYFYLFLPFNKMLINRFPFLTHIQSNLFILLSRVTCFNVLIRFLVDLVRISRWNLLNLAKIALQKLLWIFLSETPTIL